MNEERRIKKLEKLVEVLCKVAGVTTITCSHDVCQMTEGYWQDGNECGYCDGTQIITTRQA